MDGDYAVKGTLVRGYLTFLDEEQLSERVAAAGTSDVKAIFAHRPMATDWIPGQTLEALVEAVLAIGGPATVRRMVDQIMTGAVARVLRPLGESLVRLFGGSPHTLFSRMATINAPLFRGLEYTYTKGGETACTVEVRWPRPPLPSAVVAWNAALDMILRGTARDAKPIRETPREGGRAVAFAMNW